MPRQSTERTKENPQRYTDNEIGENRYKKEGVFVAQRRNFIKTYLNMMNNRDFMDGRTEECLLKSELDGNNIVYSLFEWIRS